MAELFPGVQLHGESVFAGAGRGKSLSFCTGQDSDLALMVLTGPFQLRIFCQAEFSLLFGEIRLQGSVPRGHQPWAGGSFGVAPGEVSVKFLPLWAPQRCSSGSIV